VSECIRKVNDEDGTDIRTNRRTDGKTGAAETVF
jgi:hypothetical protein